MLCNTTPDYDSYFYSERIDRIDITDMMKKLTIRARNTFNSIVDRKWFGVNTILLITIALSNSACYMGMHKRSDDLKPSEEVQYLNRINETYFQQRIGSDGYASSNIKEIEKIPTQTKNHIYSTIVRGDWVHSIATPKIDGINSYISIAYIPRDPQKRAMLLSTICKSEEPTKVVGKESIEHKIVNGFPSCPQGYTSIYSLSKS